MKKRCRLMKNPVLQGRLSLIKTSGETPHDRNPTHTRRCLNRCQYLYGFCLAATGVRVDQWREMTSYEREDNRWIDRQGIALLLIVAGLASIISTGVLWVALR